MKRTLLNSAACSLAALMCFSLPTYAQDKAVTLLSSDGSLKVEGDLIDFVDGLYVVRTVLGDIRISESRVQCSGPGCPADEVDADVTFRIAGSDTLGDQLLPLIVTGYAAEQGGEAQLITGNGDGQVIAEMVADGGFGDEIGSIMIESTSAANSFESLADQSAEIGMSSRRITREEARALRDAGAGSMVSINSERVVAVDSIVIITHPSNPVDTVSLEQLSGIYAGRITNWSELGGLDAPIKIYARGEGSGTRSEFNLGVFGSINIDSPAGLTVVAGNTEMAAAVNADETAIGYVGYAFQRGAKPLSVANSCGIKTLPNAFSAKTEEYPLNRRLYLYSRQDNLSEDARNFLDFAISEGADGVVAKSGFINLAVERQQQEVVRDRLSAEIGQTPDPYERSLMTRLVGDLDEWDRLSSTFRFASGSSRLDAKAQRDMDRLITFLKSQPGNTEVAVVGFTDSDGEFESNERLAYGRAESVAQEISALAQGELENVSFVSKGFGELAPAACNTTAQGKSINRRVEIWVRNPA
ncbi:substrate-binding domain-containing protein [Actibacterium sp. 188UL27-1]|nr:substrate-binding domain-containing protein [Actibacterium sp. 188UL27-1]